MYCNNCNKTFPEGTAFCDTCGSQLVSNPNPAPLQPSNAGTTYQQNNSGASYQANSSYQSFTPPPFPANAQAAANNQVTTGKWVGIFLINIIPVVGPLIYLIMLFVWAFGDCRYPSLKSFAKAMLIIMLIGVVISILVMIFLYPTISDLIQGNLEFDFGY